MHETALSLPFNQKRIVEGFHVRAGIETGSQALCSFSKP
jgi:hypothetical protein